MTTVRDVHGCSTDQVLDAISEDGPPFLFAGHSPFHVGKQFKIGEQPFIVTRMCSREEFDERQRQLKTPTMPMDGVICYFEAATD